MKRPLAAVGISMLVTLFVLCSVQNVLLTVAVFFAAVLCFSVSIFVKKSRQSAFLPTVFGSVAAACLLLSVFESFVFLPLEKLETEQGEITAVVLEYPYESSDKTRLYFSARITELDGKPVKAKARLSFPAKPWKQNTPILQEITKKLEPGDKLTFSGKLYKIAESSLEIHNHFKSKGTSLASYPLGFVTVERGAERNVYTVLMKERQKAINQILGAFDSETAGVVVSVLMGDKSYVSQKLYQSFTNSGAAHLMAVSGLHLSIWIMFILEMLKKRNSLTKAKIFLLMLFVFLVMFFASFSGSVRRAGLMMLLFLLSELFGERADSLNSLGFSAVCLLFQNPYTAVNASFLLSFVSVLTIITVALPISDFVCSKINKSPIPKKLAAIIRAVTVSFFMSLFINIETLPFQIAYFGGVSTVGIPVNILLIPAAYPMILCSGLYVMFYFVPIVSKLLLLLGSFFVGYCKAVVTFFGSLGFSYLSISEDKIPIAVLISVVTALLMFAVIKMKRKRKSDNYI